MAIDSAWEDAGKAFQDSKLTNKLALKLTLNKHYKSVKALFQRKLRKAYWDYIEQILDFEKADASPTQLTHKSSKQFC